MRFTDAQSEYVAKFYVAHYEVMSGREQTSEASRMRKDLLRELTSGFNRTFNLQLTMKQVRDKLKNLKRDAKDKWRQTNKEPSDNDGAAMAPQLSTAEEIVVTKMREVTANGFHPAAVVAVVNASSASDQPPTTSRPKRRRVNFDLTDDSETADSYPAMTTLKKSALRLKKRVYENELKLQAEKQQSIAKFDATVHDIGRKASVAIEEFRRFLAEQRMIARGVDLSSVPVDIPSGLDDLFQQQ